MNAAASTAPRDRSCEAWSRGVVSFSAGALAAVRGLFVEAGPSRAGTSAPVAPSGSAPAVAVLCETGNGCAAASAVALALAAATGRPCGLAAAVGTAAPGAGAGGGLPSAAGAARLLRDRGQPATACGRLVWLLGRDSVRGPAEDDGTLPALARRRDLDRAHAGIDAVGVVAGASAALGRAATAVAAPAALAIPLGRSDALDRVLRWFDGFVVVRAPVREDVVLAQIVTSLRALERPVAVMPPLGHADAFAARLGLRAPAVARAAVAGLDLADAS
jgi:hypothetical protein